MSDNPSGPFNDCSSDASSDPPPPGYVVHLLPKASPRDTSPSVAVLLPKHVKTALDEAMALVYQHRVAEHIQAEIEQRQQARDAQAKEAEDKLAADKSTELTESGANSDAGTEPVSDIRTEIRYPVYTAETLHAFKTRALTLSPDKELRRRDEEIGKLLTHKGSKRLIGVPDSPQEAMEHLRERMPHFGEVIDFLRDHLVLGARSGRGSRLPPMLLGGEPGIGKTHFAHLLAEVLGTAVHRISFDKAITGPTLTGSERRWSNSSYGTVFEAVCLGEFANPVMVLDELDKATLRQDWNPLAPLHSLLEPATARKSKDISLDFEFDCSQVTWIATANSLRTIPDSLRSRFEIFHVERPDARAALASTRCVVQVVYDELDLGDFEPPGSFVAVRLAHLTAREAQHATRKAIARAVADKRNRVTLADLPDGLGYDDSTGGKRSGDGLSKEWLH